MLAEVAVFAGGPLSFSRCDEDSEVLFLGTEDVRRFMLDHPQAALTALANLAKKLRIVASLAEQLALKMSDSAWPRCCLRRSDSLRRNYRMVPRSLYLYRTYNSHHDLGQSGRL
jgi:CRP-like cAMP-binding protein